MRLIDADELPVDVHYTRSDGVTVYVPAVPCHYIKLAPTIDAIPRADYEARLKADMVAMLTDLYLSMLELDMDDATYNSHYRQGFRTAKNMSAEVIQQKINLLKEDTT